MTLVRWPIGAKHNSISLLKHENLFQNTTTIFSRTQQYFWEHKKILENTKIFFRTKRNFVILNDSFQHQIKFYDAQTQTKTRLGPHKKDKMTTKTRIDQLGRFTVRRSVNTTFRFFCALGRPKERTKTEPLQARLIWLFIGRFKTQGLITATLWQNAHKSHTFCSLLL